MQGGCASGRLTSDFSEYVKLHCVFCRAVTFEGEIVSVGRAMFHDPASGLHSGYLVPLGCYQGREDVEGVIKSAAGAASPTALDLQGSAPPPPSAC